MASKQMALLKPELWVPFLTILNNLFLGEMMLSNLLNFPYDKVFKIFHRNLQILSTPRAMAGTSVPARLARAVCRRRRHHIQVPLSGKIDLHPLLALADIVSLQPDRPDLAGTPHVGSPARHTRDPFDFPVPALGCLIVEACSDF